ncbi:hypothetical protein A2335_01170 [Candidatus Peregrinibacteria bacterium RIFOXYB2_FULL_32_7]|nr:MAG: hypothetical protein A2335_01170 [Candidatus Peregrinibacteria bacterium RIFOXYB2_FULL_32_7]
MEIAKFIASILSPIYLVLGLSILFYTKSWQKLINKWEQDHYSMFTIALAQMFIGLIIVKIYNVWVWNVWLIITIIGWIALFKGVFYFLAPGSWIRPLLKTCNKEGFIYFGAVFALVLGVVLGYYSYFA